MITVAALVLFTLVCLALGVGRAWSDETLTERNSLVFDGRNQDYGAFRLRTDYGQRMGVALISATALLVTAVIFAYGIGKLGTHDATGDPIPPNVDVVFHDVFFPPIGPPAPENETRSVVPPPAKSTPEPGYVEAVDSIVAPPVVPKDTADTGMATNTGNTGGEAGTLDPSAGGGAGTGVGTNFAVDSVWKDFQVQEVPVFPGGENAMIDWVKNHLTFPPNMSGKDLVYVQFTVALDGSVEDVHAVKGTQAASKKAAERTVRQMPKWKPARMNGNDVRCRLTLPIHFETR